MPTKNLKVSANIYGNFRGHVTGAQSVQLGCNEFDATYWLLERLDEFPTAKILPTSCIKLEQVQALRQTLAKPIPESLTK